MTEFGIEFVPRDLYWKTTFYAIQAEKTGFSTIWITDHFNNRNVYVSLAIISAYTDKIKFGPGVTNPYLIHPIVTGQAVSTLNEIAPGRVVCGIGVGDRTTLNMVNVNPKKPLSTIRESVEIIRGISSGEKIEMQGRNFTVLGGKLNFKVGTRIPIFIGAQGPKMLALAAEVGDGVLINASHDKDIERAMQFINNGVVKAGKQLEDLDVAAYTSFSVADSYDNAVKAVKPVVAYIVAGCPESVLEKHEISSEVALKIRQEIMQGNWKEIFALVTDRMVEVFSICGSPDIVIEKIKKLIAVGTTQIVVGSPIGPDIRKSINTIATEVFPHFIKGGNPESD
jgi:5,10-methylenetetrahydromethanopterin reductase